MTKLPITADCTIFWIQNGFCVGSAMTLVRLYLFNFHGVKSGSVQNTRWMLMRCRGSQNVSEYQKGVLVFLEVQTKEAEAGQKMLGPEKPR